MQYPQAANHLVSCPCCFLATLLKEGSSGHSLICSPLLHPAWLHQVHSSAWTGRAVLQVNRHLDRCMPMPCHNQWRGSTHLDSADGCSLRQYERQQSPTGPTTATTTTAWAKPFLQCTCWRAPTSSSASMEMVPTSLPSSLTLPMIQLTGTLLCRVPLKPCAACPPTLLTQPRTLLCMDGYGVLWLDTKTTF